MKKGNLGVGDCVNFSNVNIDFPWLDCIYFISKTHEKVPSIQNKREHIKVQTTMKNVAYVKKSKQVS